MMKIAFCIPTYNRPKIIEEFLKNKIDSYINNNMDVYFYDSSENNETHNVIQKYNKKCWYIKLDSSIHANSKVYKMFQKYGLEKQYDYIWLCGDSLCYSQNALKNILNILHDRLDLLQISNGCVGESKEYTYNSAKEYFNEWGWLSTLFGAVILNSNTMLADVDWNYYETKYNRTGYICFNHVGFYYEQLLKLKRNPIIKCIDINSQDILYSPQKKRQGWYMNYYEVWAEEWINVIESLPAYYDEYKAKVIKDHQIKTGRDNEFQFIIMRKNGILNKQVFDKYSERIQKLFDFPIEQIREIAYMSDDSCNSWLGEKVDTYISKFNNDKIYIYGAGRIASKYVDFFRNHNINVDGVIVTQKMNDEFMGIPVYSLDDIASIKNDSFKIVLALNEANRTQVLELLQKKQLSSFSSFDEEIDSLIRLD